MKKVLRMAVAPILIVVSAGAVPGQKPHAVHEQTVFSEEEDIQHPVPLSSDVLRVLLQTEEARGELQSMNDSQRNNVARLFRAAEVHLCVPDEVDLVVKGVSPMSGADNTWFWVVRSAHRNPRVILFAGGNSLELMGARTNGCRNIRSLWSSASATRDDVYHFDGRRYKHWRTKWTAHSEDFC